MDQEAPSDGSFNAEDVVIYEFADWQISDVEIAMNHIRMQIKVIENSKSVSVSIQKQDEEEFDAILEELEGEWVDPVERRKEELIEWGAGDWWLWDLENDGDRSEIMSSVY
jgi:nitrogen fixation protein FixH